MEHTFGIVDFARFYLDRDIGGIFMRKMRCYFSLLSMLAMAIALPAWNTMAAGLEDGLILHVTFDEKDPVDSSPDPAEISVAAGKLEQDAGKVGGAGSFDETFLEVTDAPKLSGMEALTIAVWIKPEKTTEASIVSKRTGQGGGDAYNLFLWTGNKISGRIEMFVII